MPAFADLVESLEATWHFGLPLHLETNPSSTDLVSSNSRTRDQAAAPVSVDESAKTDNQIHCSTVMTSRSTSDPAILRSLKVIFDSVDGDADGLVSFQEIDSLLHRLMASCASAGSAMSCENVNRSALRQQYFTSNDIEFSDGRGNNNILDFAQFVRLYESMIIQPDILHNMTAANPELSNSNDGEDENLLLDEAFRLYDRNGDGFICASELASVLSELGLLQRQQKLLWQSAMSSNSSENCWSSAQISYCQSLIDRVDMNGDGVVDLDEFKAMIHHEQMYC